MKQRPVSVETLGKCFDLGKRLKAAVHKTRQNYEDLGPAWHVPVLRDHRPRLLIQARCVEVARVNVNGQAVAKRQV